MSSLAQALGAALAALGHMAADAAITDPSAMRCPDRIVSRDGSCELCGYSGGSAGDDDHAWLVEGEPYATRRASRAPTAIRWTAGPTSPRGQPHHGQLGARMLLVGLLIATAWAILLGIAYVARVKLHIRRGPSVALVGACYLVLVVTTFSIVGFDGRGAIAAAGLIVPALVASALALLSGSTGA